MPEQHLPAETKQSSPPGASLQAVIETHPFAHGLPAKYLQLIARCGMLRQVDAGHYLWRQGDRNVEAYLVLEGEIALEINVPHEGTVSFESVVAGEVAGCTALFHSARWGFDARAVTAVRAVVLDSRRMRAALECDHEFGYRLLEKCTQSLGQRLTDTRLKLVEAHAAALT